jgi:hypothetical protein
MVEGAILHVVVPAITSLYYITGIHAALMLFCFVATCCQCEGSAGCPDPWDDHRSLCWRASSIDQKHAGINLSGCSVLVESLQASLGMLSA